MQQRYPVYETSDLMVESGGDTHDVVVERIIGALGQPVDSGDKTVQQ